MKKLQKPHDDIYECEVTKKSIETAIQYLVDESLRLNDVYGANILRNALLEYGKEHDFRGCSDADEKTIVSFLRQFIGLDDNQKNLFIVELERTFIKKDIN